MVALLADRDQDRYESPAFTMASIHVHSKRSIQYGGGRIPVELGRAAGNGHRVMDLLFDHPVVTVATVRDWLDVTPAGANTLVNRLVDAGVLRETTGYARNRRFRFEPYLQLF